MNSNFYTEETVKVYRLLSDEGVEGYLVSNGLTLEAQLSSSIEGQNLLKLINEGHVVAELETVTIAEMSLLQRECKLSNPKLAGRYKA